MKSSSSIVRLAALVGIGLAACAPLVIAAVQTPAANAELRPKPHRLIVLSDIEADPDDETLPALGIDFYRRLLKLTDAQLSAGDLPRDEVQAGLAELESRSA